MSDEKQLSVMNIRLLMVNQSCNRYLLLQRINFKKTLHAKLDPGNCGGSEILKLIQLGEEYDRLL
jgi:hypothetical protein